MTTNSFEMQVTQILDKVQTLLIAKHHDYGSANLDKYGVMGILIRMSDKMARLETLTTKEALLKNAAWYMRYAPQQQTNERIEDTLLDLIGYAVQYLIRMEVEE